MYTHLIDRERERDRSEFWLFFLQNWQLASLVLYDRQERPRWKGNWGVPFKSFRWYCTITRRFFSTLASCPSSLYRHRRIATGVVSHSLDNGAEMAPPFPFSTSIEDLHGTFPRESLSLSLFLLLWAFHLISVFLFLQKENPSYTHHPTPSDDMQMQGRSRGRQMLKFISSPFDFHLVKKATLLSSCLRMPASQQSTSITFFFFLPSSDNTSDDCYWLNAIRVSSILYFVVPPFYMMTFLQPPHLCPRS